MPASDTTATSASHIAQGGVRGPMTRQTTNSTNGTRNRPNSVNRRTPPPRSRAATCTKRRRSPQMYDRDAARPELCATGHDNAPAAAPAPRVRAPTAAARTPPPPRPPTAPAAAPQVHAIRQQAQYRRDHIPRAGDVDRSAAPPPRPRPDQARDLLPGLPQRSAAPRLSHHTDRCARRGNSPGPACLFKCAACRSATLPAHRPSTNATSTAGRVSAGPRRDQPPRRGRRTERRRLADQPAPSGSVAAPRPAPATAPAVRQRPPVSGRGWRRREALPPRDPGPRARLVTRQRWRDGATLRVHRAESPGFRSGG